MPDNPTKPPNLKVEAQRLMRAQQDVETLVQQYVARLLASHEGVEAHAGVLEAIIDAVSDPLLVYDPDGKILLANRAAVQIIGLNPLSVTRAEFLAKYKFLKSDGCTPFEPDELPYVVALRELRPVVAEGLVFGPRLPPDGLWIRSSEAPILNKNGVVVGVVALFQDISDRKRMERQRNSLATLITHDLKNHLAAEDMTIALLRDAVADKVDSNYLSLLDELQTANRRYLDISNTLLELYRADLYELESCRVLIDVAELLQAAVDLNTRQALAGGVRLSLNVQENVAPIMGIPAALRQSFHNLIQNSIEVSPEGTTIEIKASSDSDEVIVEVVDEGPGMSPDQVSNLFGHARVSAGVPTNIRSTGFGLYLSKLIIQAHAGKITCSSALGQGTTFTVELPTADNV